MNAIEQLTANPVVFRGERVITLGMMDEVHGRPAGTAGRAFRAHREKLEQGRHYFVRAEATFNVGSGGKMAGRFDAILLTERGYLVLVKTFRDELAWKVQEQLVEGYFRARAAAPGDQVLTLLLDEVRDLRERAWGFYNHAIRRLDDDVADLRRQVKQLRAGARVQATGRRGGSERKVRPREPRRQLALVARKDG